MQTVLTTKLWQLTGILVICLLAYSCASKYKLLPDNTGNYVSLNDGRLGWSGIFLNESRGDVEKQLGNKFELHNQAFPSCGQYASRLVRNDRRVTLEWSADSTDATVEAIYVDLPVDERSLPAASIAEQIANRLPQLTWTASNHDYSQLNYLSNNLILIKTGNDNFLLLSLMNCLD
jgi:hypothetical protein